MNIKRIFTSGLLLMIFCSYCSAEDQTGYLLEYSYLPNKTYEIVVTTKSSNSLMMEGKSNATREKLKQYKFPIDIDSNRNIKIVTITDKANSVASIPFQSKV